MNRSNPLALSVLGDDRYIDISVGAPVLTKFFVPLIRCATWRISRLCGERGNKPFFFLISQLWTFASNLQCTANWRTPLVASAKKI